MAGADIVHILTSSQPPHQILSPQVRVALQHLHSLMPRNRGHLHEPQPLFKKSGGRLMPQVVEGQALDAAPLTEIPHLAGALVA